MPAAGVHNDRMTRMIAETAEMLFVTTASETEALLLESNLIKRLKPRYNVSYRDDKSFPNILLREDHAFPQLLKHRGAKTTKGVYFGPFASAGAVNRTLNTLQRAFLLRSCSDSVFESRTRPCLLFQIKRCSGALRGPHRRRPAITSWSRRPRAFLNGKSRAVQDASGRRDEQAPPRRWISSGAARLRDRLKAHEPSSSLARASTRPPSTKPTCSPCTAKAARPASRCSSSAPARIGATAPISRAHAYDIAAGRGAGILYRPVL